MKKQVFYLVIFLLGTMVAQAGMELTSARVYRKQGDYKQALEWYDRELEANPDNVIAHYEKGELLGEMAEEGNKPELYVGMRKEFDAVLNATDKKSVKKAQKYLPKIEELVEKYWIFQYNDAVEKFRLADNDSALNASASKLTDGDFETLSSSDKDSLKQLAKEDYWKQTQKVLELANTINPVRWETYALSSNIHSAMEQWDAAGETLQQAIDRHQRPEEASEADAQQTEEEWQRTHLDMLENLAQICYEQEHYEETIATCNEILALDPQNPLAVKFIAFSWNLLGQNEKAIDAYQAAINAQPDNTNLLYNAAQLYMQMADTAGAMKYFADFFAIDPTDFEVVFQLSVIYLEGGSFADNKKAAELLGKAVEYFPDNPVIWTNYGVALIRTGDTEEGKKAIEKAKALKGE
ncbi:tetratricopeptide repeat protein [bacterium]|nr:tetratricopeptide repeat protein [bacterium]MBU1937222.1 tetratricopeptide repeat protein [bacterium]